MEGSKMLMHDQGVLRATAKLASAASPMTDRSRVFYAPTWRIWSLVARPPARGLSISHFLLVV
jgi:hypothetical protein